MQNPLPSAELGLSDSDLDLVETLALRVRTMTIDQIARTWWPHVADSRTAALRRTTALEKAGFVVSFTAVAHPEIPLFSPAVTWAPGEPEPDFGQASYRLKTRWCLPGQQTPCVYASILAGRYFGGHGGRRPRESEESHDIHMAQVYLLYRHLRPSVARYWLSEESIRKARSTRAEKLPDAMIDAPDRRLIVEFGGAYSKAKLQSFHRYCSTELELPYEVW